jgi:hypothetical protein
VRKKAGNRTQRKEKKKERKKRKGKKRKQNGKFVKPGNFRGQK